MPHVPHLAPALREASQARVGTLGLHRLLRDGDEPTTWQQEHRLLLCLHAAVATPRRAAEPVLARWRSEVAP
jgi:hypothetical protein